MNILIHPLLQGAILLIAGFIMIGGGPEALVWNSGVIFAALAIFGVVAPLCALAAPRFANHLGNATAVWLWLGFLLTIVTLVNIGYEQIGRALGQPYGFVAGAIVFPVMVMVAVLLRPFFRHRVPSPAPAAAPLPAPEDEGPAPP